MTEQQTLGESHPDMSENTGASETGDATDASAPSETTTPHASRDPVTHPPDALVLDVSGPWAHFRRVEGNIVKQTYRIPPRTTIAGMLSAILGIGRDEYYDLFAVGDSAISVEPLTSLQTIPIPVNTLSTVASEGLENVNPKGKGPMLTLTDGEQNRQQHGYEVLRDPAYRVYVWLRDDDTMDRLASMLADGKAVYTPTLGLSEYIATIEYHGRFDVEDFDGDTPVSVDSAVPDGPERMQIGAGETYNTERSPGYMVMTSDTATGTRRRKTTAFIDYAYNANGGTVSVLDADDVVSVDGQTVVFR